VSIKHNHLFAGDPKQIILQDVNKDGLISLCVAAHVYPEVRALEVKEATEELHDSSVLVLGGHMYQPFFSNFCRTENMSLLDNLCQNISVKVADKEITLAQAMKFSRWYPILGITQGKQYYNELGNVLVDWGTDPIEDALIDVLYETGVTEYPFIEIFKAMGASIVENALATYYRVFIELPSTVKVTTVQGVDTMILESKDHQDLGAFRETYCQGVTLGLLHDNNGPGWLLYRWGNDPRIDFRKLLNNPDIGSITQRGHMATTTDLLDIETLMNNILPQSIAA
jgi:hypothetical protein